MQIGEFTVSYLSHVSFLFASPQGTTILTDPLFAKMFMWQGHIEFYLSPPDISPKDIKRYPAEDTQKKATRLSGLIAK